MSFERGSVSFRVFLPEGGLPDDAAARLQKEALPPLRAIGADPVEGWTGGRHGLDVPIGEHNASFGGLLRVYRVRAERRPPAAYAGAMIAVEEQARLAAEGRPVLDRRTRAEVRREVLARLAGETPPSLRIIPIVGDPEARMVYTGAMSEASADRISTAWHRTFGRKLEVLDPSSAARLRRASEPRHWPDAGDPAPLDPGGEFLTWLWFVAEERGGEFEAPDIGRGAFVLEGPLVLGCDEGAGALEAVVRKGEPLAGPEARAALRAGKRLRRARFTLAAGGLDWSGAFDAPRFAFRSVRLPEDLESRDPPAVFVDRVGKVGRLVRTWLHLYGLFLSERTDSQRWASTSRAMRRWMEASR